MSSAVLVAPGGLLCPEGAVVYQRRHADPPQVFGCHGLFLAHVCRSAAGQYVGVGVVIH